MIGRYSIFEVLQGGSTDWKYINKNIKNETEIHPEIDEKSMLEEGMQKGWKMKPKWREPKSRQDRKKAEKKT